MEQPLHTMNALFEQLGLPSTDGEIEAFVARHRPLPKTIALQDAGFWNQGQASFLAQALEQDADWAELVDQLDALLRE